MAEHDDARVSVLCTRIHRRRFAAAFQGPEASWCQVDNEEQDTRVALRLPVVPEGIEAPPALRGMTEKFGGCGKYRSCDLLTPEEKTKPWGELGASQKRLRAIGCLRAARAEASGPPPYELGPAYGVEGTEPLAPGVLRVGCPTGGCTTPELERDAVHDRLVARLDESKRLGRDEQPEVAIRAVREELPARGSARDARRRWSDRTQALRWQLASMQDAGSEFGYEAPGAGEWFRWAERGELLTAWERRWRLVSVSDGQTGQLLLTLVLLARLRAAVEPRRSTLQDGETVDIEAPLTWRVAARGSAFDRIALPSDSVFRGLLSDTFGIVRDDEGHFVRDTVSLAADLALLGLEEADGAPSPRARSSVYWLVERYHDTIDPSEKRDVRGLAEQTKTWMGSAAFNQIRRLGSLRQGRAGPTGSDRSRRCSNES